jgi:hypothetical protein
MASKARQSVFGGFLGLSLNLVIFPFFMRLRSSRGYDANDIIPHRVGDEQHPTVNQADRVEAQLVRCTEVVELDHIRSSAVGRRIRAPMDMRQSRVGKAASGR